MIAQRESKLSVRTNVKGPEEEAASINKCIVRRGSCVYKEVHRDTSLCRGDLGSTKSPPASGRELVAQK